MTEEKKEELTLKIVLEDCITWLESLQKGTELGDDVKNRHKGKTIDGKYFNTTIGNLIKKEQDRLNQTDSNFKEVKDIKDSLDKINEIAGNSAPDKIRNAFGTAFMKFRHTINQFEENINKGAGKSLTRGGLGTGGKWTSKKTTQKPQEEPKKEEPKKEEPKKEEPKKEEPKKEEPKKEEPKKEEPKKEEPKKEEPKPVSVISQAVESETPKSELPKPTEPEPSKSEAPKSTEPKKEELKKEELKKEEPKKEESKKEEPKKEEKPEKPKSAVVHTSIQKITETNGNSIAPIQQQNNVTEDKEETEQEIEQQNNVTEDKEETKQEIEQEQEQTKVTDTEEDNNPFKELFNNPLILMMMFNNGFDLQDAKDLSLSNSVKNACKKNISKQRIINIFPVVSTMSGVNMIPVNPCCCIQPQVLPIIPVMPQQFNYVPMVMQYSTMLPFFQQQIMLTNSLNHSQEKKDFVSQNNSMNDMLNMLLMSNMLFSDKSKETSL